MREQPDSPRTASAAATIGSAEPLSQSGTRQAEIVTLVRRARVGGHGTARTLAEARSVPTWDRLVDDIAWRLAEMPLRRLQRVGNAEGRFIYEIAWDGPITRRAWRSGAIDTTVRLQPGVGDHLIGSQGSSTPRPTPLGRASLPPQPSGDGQHQQPRVVPLRR